MLFLFMNFEINLLIVVFDIKVAGHSKQLAELTGPLLAMPLYAILSLQHAVMLLLYIIIDQGI